MPPLIVDVAVQHRAALLAREQAAMAEQARRWLGVEQALRTSTEALALQMANGAEAASVEQLILSRRYRELRAQVNDELFRYRRYIEQRTTDGQREMVARAIEHSATAIGAVATEAQLVVQFNRLPVSAVEAMVGLAGDGSPLRDILADATNGASEAMAQRLVDGIALGRNPIEVARQAIRAGLGTSFTRMQAIARTEQLRVYRITTLQAYEASRVVKSYRRLSARDDRVCPGCLFADGQIYPISHGFDAHPQCIVGGTLVNSPTILATSKRWFDGQVIEIRTVTGNVLTVTENHPILTDKGWIAANLLQEGDNVISSSDGQRTISLADPNDYSRPTVIEDVLESFARKGGMIPVSVPTTAVDFHGDGMNGNVNIVRADSLLENRRQVAISQPTGKQSFAFGGVGLPALSTNGVVAFLLERLLSTARCAVHGGSDAGDFFRRALTRQEPVSVGLTANNYAMFNQSQPDNISISTIGGSQGVFGLTGNVAGGNFGNGQFDAPPFSWDSTLLQVAKQSSVTDSVTGTDVAWGIPGDVVIDRIVNLTSRQFSGHVYNLQTSTGWYIAGGIITHNCRCTLVPVLYNVPPVAYQTGQEWFRSQPEGTQLAILGRGRFDLWRRGEASLDDMVSRDWSDTWGGSLRATRVRDLG